MVAIEHNLELRLRVGIEIARDHGNFLVFRDDFMMVSNGANLIETGKPAKVALTAIMRKLIVLANALLKANRPWTPKTA